MSNGWTENSLGILWFLIKVEGKKSEEIVRFLVDALTNK
jgi:hypothetical protein